MLHKYDKLAKDGCVTPKQEAEDRWRWSHRILRQTCCIAEYWRRRRHQGYKNA